MDKLQPKDFISYGLSPEFLGRISLICQVEPLSQEEMEEVLRESKTSVLSVYRNLFGMANNKLEFDQSAISYLAGEASHLGLGIRGLRTLLNPYMMDLLFRVGDRRNLILTITAKNLKNHTFPPMRYHSRPRTVYFRPPAPPKQPEPMDIPF